MTHRDAVAEIRIPIPETVTWAGEFPGLPDFVLTFGTEGGRVWSRTENGVLRGPVQVVESGEAINGIASANGLVAVSSRSEVVFSRRDPAVQGTVDYCYDGGAHGVISTPSGRIIAPLGPLGILVVGGQTQLYHKELITRGRELYFYRLVSLGTTNQGDELFAGAWRHGGIVAISLDREETASVLVAYRSPERDIVDVCAIGGTSHPRAIASLGSDGSVHLSSDLVSGSTPVTLRFSQIEGVGYTIRCGQGHIFVLTSGGLYIIPHLVSRFLGGQRVDGLSTVRHIKMEAFDIAVAYEKWLLSLQPGSVSLIRLDTLCASELSDQAQQPAYHVPSLEASPVFDLETVLV